MPGDWRDYIRAVARDGQGGIVLTGRLGTGKSTAQVYTERIRAGSRNWTCLWPEVPTTDYHGDAITVSGVNVFVAGTIPAADYPGSVLLGFVR